MTQQKRLYILYEQFADLAGYKTTATWDKDKKEYSNEYLKLDHNSIYGGYRLDIVNKNSSESFFSFSSRFSNKEMASYLQGLIQGYSLGKKGKLY